MARRSSVAGGGMRSLIRRRSALEVLDPSTVLRATTGIEVGRVGPRHQLLRRRISVIVVCASATS